MIGRVVLGLEESYARFGYKFNHPSGVLLGRSTIDVDLMGGYLMYRGRRFVPWMSIYVDGSAKDKMQDVNLAGAFGVGFGLGYKIFEWLQLSAEYRSYSFDKYTKGGIETALPSTDREKFNGSEALIGITIPFEIGVTKH
jgi:hypothetical protein